MSQSEVGEELANPKLQSFVQQSLMGPPLARLRQCTGLSSARLRSSRICFRCNRIWLQKFWVYWEMFNWNLLLVHDALDSPREGGWQPKLPRTVLFLSSCPFLLVPLKATFQMFITFTLQSPKHRVSRRTYDTRVGGVIESVMPENDIFVSSALSVCLSFTNPVLVQLHLLRYWNETRSTGMLSTSWRNSSLSNWRHCTFTHAVQCSTSLPRNKLIAWMSSFTPALAWSHLSMSIQSQVDSLCRSSPA